jgi:RNA polymerase sigma-70 factor (ECF subfamily)
MVSMDGRETERVWREFHAGLHGFVRRRVGEPADADDIVQRVFLQVHRALPTLRDTDRLSAWLYRTARHAIADFYRSPVREREVASGSALEVAEQATIAEAIQDEQTAFAELAICLQPLLAELAEADREALRLVDVEGVTQVEAADRLGLSVSGMKSRVQRARARLRDVVDACCNVEFDRRGGVVGYEPRADDRCGCGPGSPPGSGRCD